MQSKQGKIKMIIATLGLEPHWRGAVTITRILRDFGMEIIYIGNAYPKEIIQTAIQEDIDVIGVSSLMGSHLTLGSELLEIAKQKGILNGIVFVIGGIFPPEDVHELKDLGFDGVFGSGASGEEIYNFIRNAVNTKGNHT